FRSEIKLMISTCFPSQNIVKDNYKIKNSKRRDFIAVSTSVCLSDELNKKLTLWTNAHNISRSEFIAQVLAEKLEDVYDIQEADLTM
ncbi:DUF6290 family protein, partial [Streptococcus mutans]|nr:DUF6290 family protein [Streptococcus mutans]